MKVLFDQNAPAKLRRHLSRHTVTLARNLGWEELKNGDLLAAAEAQGFDCLVTCDRNLFYQQNLAARKIAIVLLPSGNWPNIEPLMQAIVMAVDQATPSSFQAIFPPLAEKYVIVLPCPSA